MDEIRIHELSESTELANGDNFVIDNANSRGTKRYSVSEFMKLIPKLVYEWTPMIGYGQDVLVTYEGKLYRNKTDSTAISPTWQGSTVWEETSLSAILPNIVTSIAPLHNSSDSYHVGDFCIKDYKLYKCIADNQGTWSSADWERADIAIDMVQNVVARIEEELTEDMDNALALGTASGSIASFTDGSTLPMKKLEVDIEPVQEGSGEPSPTNVRPISGWDEVDVTRCGKNLADGEYTANYLGTSGELVASNAYRCTDYVEVTGLTKLKTTISTDYQSMWLWRIASYDANKSFIELSLAETKSEGTFEKEVTLPVNAKYIRACALVQSTDWTIYDKDKMHTYTIDLDGTRYGGKLDVVSGELVVDRGYFKYINVSTTSGIAVTDGWRCNFTCPIDDINRGKWSIQTGAIPIFNKISSVAKGYGANEYTVTLPNVTSKQEADAMLEGLEICYKLATPLTIQLTPTEVKSLLATNNIFADTGDILDAIYVRNANITINELIQRIENLENA